MTLRPPFAVRPHRPACAPRATATRHATAAGLLLGLALAAWLPPADAARHAKAPRRAASSAASAAPAASSASSAGSASAAASAATPGANPADAALREAREAFGRRDRERLAALRPTIEAARHPLLPWVDYWQLNLRLTEASADEVAAFFARWPGSYVEDRLRNDWLLELGRRRDWAGVAREYPRFRMNDDREVSCYALVADMAAGNLARDAARSAWMNQRDADDGCQLLAQALLEAKLIGEDDVWRKLRQATETGKARYAKSTAQMLPTATQRRLTELWDNPARFLAHAGDLGGTRRDELISLALARIAASDPATAASLLAERWQGDLSGEQAAWAWAQIGRQAAQSLKPEALDAIERAWAVARPERDGRPGRPDWSDETLAWHARAALRSASGNARWTGLLRATDAMGPAERAEPAWAYWRARARLAMARDGAAGDAARAEARAQLQALASPLSFYGLLAAEDLGLNLALPARPAAPAPGEREAAHANPGLQRALAATALDLRDEARREWNYTLRGMDDRSLLAAAQWACELQDWQLCINTSERTRTEADVGTRYVTPYAADIAAAAQKAGVDAALVQGIIRQETRFMAGLRSHAGASGLMQLMPATAKWVAKKHGIDWKPEYVTDPVANLTVGSTYVRHVLDSFGGSVPLAAAAYNAGPARSRRWREGPVLEAAIWVENIPFTETRDYVKKVSTNAAIYAALAGNRVPQLKARLGAGVGPRDASQPDPSADLP